MGIASPNNRNGVITTERPFLSKPVQIIPNHSGERKHPESDKYFFDREGGRQFHPRSTTTHSPTHYPFYNKTTTSAVTTTHQCQPISIFARPGGGFIRATIKIEMNHARRARCSPINNYSSYSSQLASLFSSLRCGCSIARLSGLPPPPV